MHTALLPLLALNLENQVAFLKHCLGLLTEEVHGYTLYLNQI